ncbi:AfsR/SARP family transcriptional regulator [Labedaea rhizosphaerae]|uniref:AfsR/SARP family transcriptional regulator n=1 Tax=Labedaea rhizosphaerae TaxID=598644 RepID=UPI001FB5BD97|nr:BTAD domain-containing putative transcriptional regulator [Labedaea rhizosphaerae]
MRIDVLGILTVRVSGRVVPIESTMQRTVLGFLALQPRQLVSKHSLVELLWGDRPPSSAVNLVQTYVARLRRRVPGLVITGGRGGYRLDVDHTDIDVARFDAFALAAQEAVARGASADGAAACRAALALWRDDVLTDLGERAQTHPSVVAMRRKRVDVALRYAAAATAAGEQAAAATEVQRMLGTELLHESLHAALMRLLAASGQQAEALAVFDAVSRRLREELGIDPGPELRAAHSDVLRASAALPGQPLITPRELPARPTQLVGRGPELERLRRLLGMAHDESPVVAVCGAGGVGKTALVLRWAHDNVNRFPDGQLWADLRGYGPGQPSTPDEVIEHLLRALGVGTAHLPADLTARAAMLRSAMAGRRMLLVLDNARDSAQVRSLLPGGPPLVTVVTSRDALRSLVAADGAVRLRLTRLDPDAGRELLSAGIGPEVLHTVTATRIVEHCDGLPLALRIVRERLATASAAEVRGFAEELGGDERLDALNLNEPSSDFSVRAALNWSYRTLPPAASTLMRRIPLCRVPTVDAAVAEALTDLPGRAAAQALDALLAAHLLERVGTDRYRIHDLVLMFATERLQEEESAADITAGRRRLALALARTAEAALASMRRNIPLRRPLLQDCATSRRPATTWTTGHADMIVAVAQDLIANEQHDLGWALLERGWHATYTIADTSRFESALTVAFDVAVRAGDMSAATGMNRLLAVTYATNHSLERAERALQRGIALAAEAGMTQVVIADTGNLARVWLLRGDLSRSRSAMHEVASMQKPSTDERRPHLSNLIELECQHGDLAAAEELSAVAREHMAVAADRDEVRELAVAVARVDSLAERWPQVRERLAAMEDDNLAVTNDDVRSRLLILLARACQHTGAGSRAEAMAHEAVAVTRTLGWRSREAEALGVVAEILLAQGEASQALPLLGEALDRCRGCVVPYPECTILLLLAEAHHALGHRQEAGTAAQAASVIADRCDYQMLAARAAYLNRRVAP